MTRRELLEIIWMVFAGWVAGLKQKSDAGWPRRCRQEAPKIIEAGSTKYVDGIGWVDDPRGWWASVWIPNL